MTDSGSRRMSWGTFLVASLSLNLLLALLAYVLGVLVKGGLFR